MIQQFKKIILSMSVMLLMGIPLTVPVAVSAQAAAPQPPTIQGSLCGGAKDLQIPAGGPNQNPTTTCQTNGQGDTKINSLLQQIINIFSVIVGVVAVIMIIYAGFRYITSGGDSSKVGNAKNTILYALIGLVIVALSQVIVRFVLSKVV